MLNKDKDFSIMLVSILYFILGVVFIAATNELIKTFNYILVCICAIIGVIQFIQFFISKKYQSGNYTDLFIAIVFIWVSLVLYVYYGFIINILPILFSLYLFIMACDMLIKFVQFKIDIKVNRKKYLILSILALIVGLLLIFNPGSMIIIYLKVTGVYLLIVGILYFADYIKCLRNK